VTFDQAKHLYDRCRFDELSQADWITLVEGLGARHDALAEELAFAKDELEYLESQPE
jgi:hypothetical protein